LSSAHCAPAQLPAGQRPDSKPAPRRASAFVGYSGHALLASSITSGMPAAHTPAPSHVSAPLRTLPSEQLVPLEAGACTTPTSASHESTVHGLPPQPAPRRREPRDGPRATRPAMVESTLRVTVSWMTSSVARGPGGRESRHDGAMIGAGGLGARCRRACAAGWRSPGGSLAPPPDAARKRPERRAFGLGTGLACCGPTCREPRVASAGDRLPPAPARADGPVRDGREVLASRQGRHRRARSQAPRAHLRAGDATLLASVAALTSLRSARCRPHPRSTTHRAGTARAALGRQARARPARAHRLTATDA
jgi:hypothetical protein